MKVYLIYNRQTTGERTMSDYAKRLDSAQTDYELVDADTPSGISLVESLDVMGRPAIAVVRDDESIVQIWQDAESFPPPQEISYLARQ